MLKNMNFAKMIFMLLLVPALFLSSCITVPIDMATSSTPLTGKTIAQNLGKAEGRSGTIDILMCYSIGRPDIDLAIQRAVESKGGDALINVRVYQEISYFIAVSYTVVIVTGDVVKFSQ